MIQTRLTSLCLEQNRFVSQFVELHHLDLGRFLSFKLFLTSVKLNLSLLQLAPYQVSNANLVDKTQRDISPQSLL